MEAQFDSAAKSYDNKFTNLFTARQQRNVVWKHLSENFTAPLHILEINCGTGEDALFMSHLGHTVLATDISEKMIDAANQKQMASNNTNKAVFMVCGFEKLDSITQKFDVIFSNFGGLNCISPEKLTKLENTFANLLNPNGHVVAVLMPPVCAWEIIYFLVKLNFSNALRRLKSQPVSVMVQDTVVNTWYYSPASFKKCFKKFFTPVNQIPVGIAIPPPFMEPLVEKRNWLKKLLTTAEKKLNSFSFLANISDHYLIDFKQK